MRGASTDTPIILAGITALLAAERRAQGATMQSSHRAVFVSLLACAGLHTTATEAADLALKQRLDARGLKYEVDGDGDFRVTYNYSKEKRTQLVFVSGPTQSVGRFKVREIFSPAAQIERDGINCAKAMELLAESRTNKIGSWETKGDVLYFVIKVSDTVSAEELESLMDIAAETADDMEIELSGDRDDL